jgi:hypothetical protein
MKYFFLKLIIFQLDLIQFNSIKIHFSFFIKII